MEEKHTYLATIYREGFIYIYSKYWSNSALTHEWEDRHFFHDIFLDPQTLQK